MNATPAVDFAPALELLAIAVVLAGGVLGLWWWRQRRAGHASRRTALTAWAVFLTADLIVFGAFTRLTDSGLGCPDWPGCYGAASPIGASSAIDAAQRALPTGPVTATKAWIEMIHRYLAMGIGALILALNVVLWRSRHALGQAPLWAAAALVWVIVQGLFGKYTVTLRLYPAVVTAHLLGGMVLLALLVAQLQALRPVLSAPAVGGAGVALWLLAAQIALGGWVSSNYAVLACRGFPDCNGQWWPQTDFAQGFTLLRELGRAGVQSYVAFDALVAIHLAHRIFALVLTVALLTLAAKLWRAQRGSAVMLLALLALQIGSGLSNVLLDWPLLTALLHSAGAAALVVLLTSLACRTGRRVPSARAAAAAAGTWLHRGA